MFRLRLLIVKAGLGFISKLVFTHLVAVHVGLIFGIWILINMYSRFSPVVLGLIGMIVGMAMGITVLVLPTVAKLPNESEVLLRNKMEL